MPTTTRSKLNEQKQGRDTGGEKSATRPVKQTCVKDDAQDRVSANSTAKGKDAQTHHALPSKRRKQQQPSSGSVNKLENPIVINRAPVLQLWAAVTVQFLHPDLSWPACLSIGNAISALCAVSKGRAIGMIEPKNDTDPDRNDPMLQDCKEVSVMGFVLHLKNDAVLMSGKPKRFSEAALKGKFGEENYNAARKAIMTGLETWSANKSDLDKKAFRMYESFRPNVASGQRGWGRKGELNLHHVVNTIERAAK